MTASDQESEGMMRVLYAAAYSGDVLKLNSLIEKDQSILFRNSQTANTETPLHISALLGHRGFTKFLLDKNSNLAYECDASQRTALHFASAEGHTNIVKELLKFFDKACLKPDEEGKIPLHYAAMRGQTEVVQELINVMPQSLNFRDYNGKTAFHLCVTHNHLETLKALVDLELANNGDDYPNFTSSDGAGNTVLHLAIKSKQVESVRYLLSIRKVVETASLNNKIMCLIDYTKDSRSLEIQRMLMNAGMLRMSGWRKISRIISNISIRNADWLNEVRNNLSLVATVIATITFQALINPPGGFIQQGIATGSNDPFKCYDNGTNSQCPGDAVSAVNYPHYFHPYLKYNTVCFIASLSVALLLVSGVPLKQKAVTWILSIGMCITLTFLALAYIQVLYLVTPNGDLFQSVRKYVKVSLYIWIGFLVLVAVLITLSFLIWLVNKCKRKFRRRPWIISTENYV